MKIILVNHQLPIDLIHSQDTGYSGLAAAISGKILRIPVIVSSHGIRQMSLTSIIRGRLKKILLKIEHQIDLFVISHADAILVVNPSIKRYFKQMLDSAKRIEVIPIPIKLRDFTFSEINRNEVRKDIGIEEEDKHTIVVGFIGRFSAEKNLVTLLASFANVAQVDSYIKLVLVGTGNAEHELREYVKERAIEDKVIFSGVRYDIGRVLAGFDIFVLPSYTEGLSTALLEAMASGRAIVCSAIPANQALVTHNQEALLVNPNKSIELERAIRLLSKSESLRLKLGQNAKMRVSQYDEEIVFPMILDYYKNITKAPLS